MFIIWIKTEVFLLVPTGHGVPYAIQIPECTHFAYSAPGFYFVPSFGLFTFVFVILVNFSQYKEYSATQPPSIFSHTGYHKFPVPHIFVNNSNNKFQTLFLLLKGGKHFGSLIQKRRYNKSFKVGKKNKSWSRKTRSKRLKRGI